MEQEKSSILAIKDVIVTIREATITVVVLMLVLLLFFSPNSIKQTLSQAGFKSVSIAGFGEMELQEVQKELENAKAQVEVARDELDDVENKFQQVNASLVQLKTLTQNPIQKERLETISKEINISKEKTAVIKRDLSKTIQKQDQILQNIKIRKAK